MVILISTAVKLKLTIIIILQGIQTFNHENDFSILTISPAVDLRVDSDHSLLQTATHADLMRYTPA